jgi:hypothetical protein
MTAALEVTAPSKMWPSRCRVRGGGGFRGGGDWSTDGQKTEERQLDFLFGSGFNNVWRGNTAQMMAREGIWRRLARDREYELFCFQLLSNRGVYVMQWKNMSDVKITSQVVVQWWFFVLFHIFCLFRVMWNVNIGRHSPIRMIRFWRVTTTNSELTLCSYTLHLVVRYSACILS